MPPEVITIADDELHAVQEKAFEILVWFTDFCREHHLRVYLYAGTLIGAARQGDFIPWDDDVDVMMPLPDLRRLQEIWPAADTGHYSFVQTTKDLVTRDPIPSVCDDLTTAVKIQHWDIDMPQGLSIDIFPLCGCPTARWRQHAQVAWSLLFGLYHAQFAPRTHGRLTYLLARLALAVVPSKRLRYRLWRFAERHMTSTPFGSTPYVRMPYGGPGDARQIYPSEIYETTIEGDFHGRKMPLPVGYEQCLTVHFGDWQKLPPQEARYPHHELVFLDLSTPYIQHKGIHYCL